jgi:hypothetical protein
VQGASEFRAEGFRALMMPLSCDEPEAVRRWRDLGVAWPPGDGGPAGVDGRGDGAQNEDGVIDGQSTEHGEGGDDRAAGRGAVHGAAGGGGGGAAGDRGPAGGGVPAGAGGGRADDGGAVGPADPTAGGPADAGGPAGGPAAGGGGAGGGPALPRARRGRVDGAARRATVLDCLAAGPVGRAALEARAGFPLQAVLTDLLAAGLVRRTADRRWARAEGAAVA